MKFEDFVRNKRVAIIGGARSIKGTDLGEKIDSYDTVVRINFHWPCSWHFDSTLKSDWTEDIGHRTDVLAMALVTYNERAMKQIKPKLVVTGGQALVHAANEGDTHLRNLFATHIGKGEERTQQIIAGRNMAGEWYHPAGERVEIRMSLWRKFHAYVTSTQTPWHGFSSCTFNHTWNSSTGGKTLIEVWKYNPREVFIAGFDFCTKDWAYTASVHDYGKDGEYALMMARDPRVELSEPTRKSLSSLKIF